MAATGLAHIVYFELHDKSPASVQAQIAACKKYLDGHPGTIHFSVGSLNQELARPVNDRSFDVALHVIFDSKAAHDAYQVAPRHLEFINENKPAWKVVRVFDSDLA